MMQNGLNYAQATSRTAEKIVDLFLSDERKALNDAADRQLEATRKQIADYQQYADTVTQLTDERAVNAVALFNAVLTIAETHGMSNLTAVREAGYIVYAYLAPSIQSDSAEERDRKVQSIVQALQTDGEVGVDACARESNAQFGGDG